MNKETAHRVVEAVAGVANVGKRKSAKASPAPKAAKSTPDEGETRCAGCGSSVAEDQINHAALGPTASTSDIDALRAERQAHLAGGDLASKREALALRDALAEEKSTSGPTPGPDQCPACGAESVTVDERRLSPIGRAQLRRDEDQRTAEDVEARRAKLSERSRSDLAAHNQRAAARRDALRGTK